MSTENFRQHPRGWRSEAMHNTYADAIEAGEYSNKTLCHLCEATSIIEFEYWRVIKNKFPYDTVAVHHDMIIPKIHKKEEDLTTAELQELRVLKNTYINDNFQMMIESVPHKKSIPEHFHLHLLVIKTIT